VARVVQAGRGRRWLIIVGVALVLLLVGLTALSGFFVDLLWFREVGFSQVFWTILRTKIALGLIFGAAFFAVLYANLLIVRLLTPSYRALGPEQEVIERYRLAFEPYAWWLLPVIAGVIALFVGLGVATQWKTFLLWRNSSGVTFGSPDPLFHRDPAFYVFGLPWLEFVQGWLFSSLVGITFITAVAHYLWGGIRPQAPAFTEKVTPQVKAHLSVLLGLIVLTKAWGYYLGTFDLLTSRRGVVEGASYTDVKAQLPALRILTFIAVACAILFLVNIRMRGWAIPVIALGLLALVSITAGAAYPAFVQRFQVGPQEFSREQPYIDRNIEATRAAFALDTIQAQQRTVAATVTPQQVQANDATVSNVRLWRPDILRENFESLQRIRQYYVFNDVDVDRYDLNGQRRVVMLSAREVNQDTIPGGGGTWLNKHLVYTHGFGAVAAPVNAATTEGAPQFTLSDIPPVGQPSLDVQPRIYYGENTAGAPFVVVDTGAKELDYSGTEGSSQQVSSTYQGQGGIPIGGFFKRALFAWRFRDVNLLISGLIQSNSKILIFRDIQDRVPKAAPFLTFDSDPYAAIVGGRVVWIWDAYTTTNGYPYSQVVPLDQATPLGPGQSGLHGTANYIRNSVKVVVDAYDGTMHYYVSDPTDPIIRVWEKAFPDLFTPLDQAPAELAAHFRYPENLFQVQASQFANYHVTDASVFYQKQDFWQVPFDPTIPANTNTNVNVPIRPYYLLMRLPGSTQESFVLVLPFNPEGRQNIVAWMAANSDSGPDYGKIVAFEFPPGQNVDGPSQVFARMRQDPRFSADQTLFGQSGSQVKFGDFLIIPMGNGLLYVEPVYVRSAQENAIPELKRVLVANGGDVGLGSTLTQALNDSLGGQVVPPSGGGGGPTPGGSVQQQITRLLKQALDHFAAADAALKAGNLALYQSEVNAAQAAIARANQLAAKAGGTSPAPSTSPSPTVTPGSPTPSPSG
jgi:uncharacterized membrane protein (UPF0182 family)